MFGHCNGRSDHVETRYFRMFIQLFQTLTSIPQYSYSTIFSSFFKILYAKRGIRGDRCLNVKYCLVKNVQGGIINTWCAAPTLYLPVMDQVSNLCRCGGWSFSIRHHLHLQQIFETCMYLRKWIEIFEYENTYTACTQKGQSK